MIDLPQTPQPERPIPETTPETVPETETPKTPPERPIPDTDRPQIQTPDTVTPETQTPDTMPGNDKPETKPQLHLLHLEDDKQLSEILLTSMQIVSPDVLLKQFIDSDSAMTYIRAHLTQIDLYILDIRVPGKLNGLEVAQRIRELNAPGAIVLTSAYRKPTQQMIKKLNAQWFQKPWHIIKTSHILLRIARGENPSLPS